MTQQPSTVLYDIEIEEGKYRFVYHMDAKPMEVYRYGQRWKAFERMALGNKAIMCLVARIDELQGKTIHESDLAVAIAEHAFKAGWDARDNKEGPDYDSDRENAWDDYDPPEELKGRNF